MEFITRIFQTTDFPPRWYCGKWTPTHGWIHIISDIIVWGAYMAIPIMLIYFLSKRKENIIYPKVVWLFAAFIFSCGTGHLIEAGIFWWPAYRLAGTVKIITASVSLATVIALFPLIPKALALPGLADVNKQLLQEIEERKEAEAKLEAQAAVLLATNRELDEFVYFATHDLQEPLRTLSSYCDLLKEDLPGELNEDATEDLDFINDAARRMKSLLESLLHLSRLNRATLRTDEFSLTECAQETVNILHTSIEESGATVNIPDDLPHLRGDRTLIGTVLQNLIQNGIKFQTETPTLHITAEKDDEGWVFGVQDNGIGIEAKYAEKIFQPFQRLHGMTEYPGSGIGLSICRKCIERHGGRLWVESKFGEGSHFKFSFPTSRIVLVPENKGDG